jgi:predicted GNAT family acetyltransferase
VHIVRTDGAVAFLDLAGPLLRREEARNHLILSVAAIHAADASAYDFHEGWIALDPEPVAAALWTAPRQLLLGDPVDDGAIAPLVRAVAEDAPGLPGVMGNRPAVDRFVDGWTAATGRIPHVIARLTDYALEEVRAVPRAPGAARPARREDRRLVVTWMQDFADAAPSQDELVAAELKRFLGGRLEAADAGYRLWVGPAGPVCLAGFMGPTGTGIRVGPVYTPVEHRGHGYAKSLLADLSEELLGKGFAACYLASDVENEPANALYEAVGFRRTGDAEVVAFQRD